MKFVTNRLCHPFYPYLELLGVFAAVWSLLYIVRGFMDIDNINPPPTIWELLSVIIAFTLGWFITFFFLNKKQLSVRNTAIVATIGAFLFILSAEIFGRFIYEHNMTITRPRLEELIGVFIICFVLIFFWGLVFQLFGTVIATLVLFFKNKLKNDKRYK